MRATQMFIVAPVMAGLAAATASSADGCEPEKGTNSYTDSVPEVAVPKAPSPSSGGYNAGAVPVYRRTYGSDSSNNMGDSKNFGKQSGDNFSGANYGDKSADSKDFGGKQSDDKSSGFKQPGSNDKGSGHGGYGSGGSGDKSDDKKISTGGFDGKNAGSKESGSGYSGSNGFDGKNSGSKEIGSGGFDGKNSGSKETGSGYSGSSGFENKFSGNKDVGSGKKESGSEESNSGHQEESGSEYSSGSDESGSDESGSDSSSSESGSDDCGSDDCSDCDVPTVPKGPESGSSTTPSVAVGTALTRTAEKGGYATDVPSVPEGPKAPQTTEAPKGPDSPKVPEVPKGPESGSSTTPSVAVGTALTRTAEKGGYATDVPSVPEVPKAPQTTETPKGPDSPKVPEVPKGPESGSSTTPSVAVGTALTRTAEKGGYATDVPSVPEVPKAPQTTETPKGPDSPKVPEVPKGPESGSSTTPSVAVGTALTRTAEKGGYATDVPSVPEVPKAPQTTETPKGPDSPKVPEVPKGPESGSSTTASFAVGTAPTRPAEKGGYATDVPSVPSVPKSPQTTETPKGHGSDEDDSHSDDESEEGSCEKCSGSEATISHSAGYTSSTIASFAVGTALTRTAEKGGYATDVPSIPEIPGNKGPGSSTSGSSAVGPAPTFTPSVAVGTGLTRTAERGGYATDAGSVPGVPGHSGSVPGVPTGFGPNVPGSVPTGSVPYVPGSAPTGSAPSIPAGVPTGSVPSVPAGSYGDKVVPTSFATSVTSSLGSGKGMATDAANSATGSWNKFSTGTGAVPTSVPSSSYGFNLGDKGEDNYNGLGDIVATIEEIISESAETLGTIFYGEGSRTEADCQEKDCWNGGQCSFVDYDLPAGIDGTASIAGDIWNKGSNCGGCVAVKHEGQDYTLMITGQASSASNATHLELTPKTWDLFAASSDYHVISGLKWNWTPCPIEEEPLWVRVHSEATQHWFAITIENARERTSKLEVSPDAGKTWKECSLNDYNLHVLDGSLDTESVYVRATSITGKVVTVPDVSVAKDAVAKADKNYL
ncbi:IgA FC receptor [Ceratocystis platani]|uniref:IgA FC receptor n=1 Tax=Ceratocystis fimbriata f. sp. platani TaxID=88771 RepID=A0A0F8B2J2_CERFI|nr:IgA FC receptor [Ceratocystis platani]